MLTDFKEPIWAHVELFGHKTYFGRIQEVTRFGVVGAAIEPMTAAGFVETQFRGGAAIYGVTPMEEQDVRRAVMPRAWRPCQQFQASVALADLCLTCGRSEPEHQAEREQIAALPARGIPDAETVDIYQAFVVNQTETEVSAQEDAHEAIFDVADNLREQVATILQVSKNDVTLQLDNTGAEDPTELTIAGVTIARAIGAAGWAALASAGLPVAPGRNPAEHVLENIASALLNDEEKRLLDDMDQRSGDKAPLSGALGH